MGIFSHSSATANRNFSSSPAMVKFHFFHWSDCSHLGDFSEFVCSLLNREGNSTFCHCIFLAQRGPLLQPWHSDTTLSRPQPSTSEEDATNASNTAGARCPMSINRNQMKSMLELSIHRCIILQSYSGSTHTQSITQH